MKFGKHIQTAQITEWSAHYLDYKGLKKIINSLTIAPGDKAITSVTVAASLPQGVVPEDERYKFLQSQKAAFFFKLERELEKINSFYLQKENELRVRLRSLVDKKKILASKRGRYTRESTSLNSLKEAFRQFDQDWNKLQRFVELNGTGFRKILKKWDKRSKSSTRELYLSRQVDIQPCFNNDVLSELADQAATNLLELDNLADGIVTASTSPITTPGESQKIDLFDHADTAVVDDLENELYKAVVNGQTSTVLDILERIRQHSIPEDRDRISRVFWHTCSEASAEMIQPLVDTGLVNFNYVDDINDRSCLHEAAITGRLQVIELCVKQGVEVQTTDVYGRTPLHYASMYGYVDCATFLLSHSADVVPVDHDGFNPLIYAIINGHTQCVEVLLRSGASVEPLREGDHNPLSLACQYGHKDIATILTGKGAQILPNTEGLFPLHLAAREGHADLCRLLTEKNAALDTPDKYNGWTPVFYAASEGHIDCLRILLEAGCKVNYKDENGATPLYYAAWEGEIECVNLLIEAGCEVEIVDERMEDTTSAAEPMEDVDIDTIPSLSLPPPIIPFRIYGHNYLDKKYQIQLTLGHHSARHPKSPIHLYGNARISSLKLIITSKPDLGAIPHSVILPLGDDREIFSFQVDRVDNFSLEFDIFPTFGSKVIGKGVALPVNFDLGGDQQQLRRFGPLPNGTGSRCVLPLFDAHLKVVGELAFEFAIIRPFQGVQLEIGGRVETYWKSTNTVGPLAAAAAAASASASLPVEVSPVATPITTGGTGTGSAPSLITVSSLSGEYVQVVVQVTRDTVPVVFAGWRLPVEGFDLCVADVSYEQFRAFGERQLRERGEKLDERAWHNMNSVELHRLIHDSYLSLEHVLKTLPTNLGVNLEIKYPTASVIASHRFSNITEINSFVDSVLQCVYDHAHTSSSQQTPASVTSSSHRQLIFSSFNPAICTAVNWKQPNYAVFFNTYCGFTKATLNRGKKRKTPDGTSGDAAVVQSEEDLEEDRRCTSLKEAVKFAKTNNLLGVICEAKPLVQVPALITNVKESGLILTTFGAANNEPRNVRLQERYGVDAMMIDGVIKYSSGLGLDVL